MLQTETDDVLWREVIVADIRRIDLRNLMVLTVQAMKITACTSDGQTLRARMEMIERFLLNRIDGQRTGFAIDLADEYTIMIPATATDTRLAIGNLTMMRTEQALHPIPIRHLIISTRHQNTIASYT